MNTRFSWQVLLSAASHFLTPLFVAMYVSPLLAADTSIETVRTAISGVYMMEEWHKDGDVFRPPQVEGRYVLLNGVVMFILHNRIQSASQTTTVAFGRYVLDSKKFSYGYDNASVFTETASGATVSHKPFWEGMRSFAVDVQDGVVRLRSESGQQEMMFSADRLTYSENGRVLRVWHRLKDK
jgi:hypothetical protein